jgi:hypothetical protein
MVIGVRRALERGSGSDSIPVANALVGTAVAVTGLCGIAVFGASLSHLTSTPRLYGQAFQFWHDATAPGPDAIARATSRLESDPDVTGLTVGVSSAVTIGRVATDVIAGQPLRGPLLVSPVSGRLPSRDDEIALGTKTLHLVGAHVGSTVRVTAPLASGGERTSTFRVVGTMSFPPDFGVVGLNRGAIFTLDGLLGAQCAPGPGRDPCEEQIRRTLSYVLLVRVKPGAEGRRAVARYVREAPDATNLPVTPAKLVNFGEAVNFPLILGLLVVVFGAASLVHVLVVSVARRRRELGLLKTLGLLRHQVVAAVCWQATTVALIGVAFGVPLGIAAGRATWRAFATNLGVVPVPRVPAVAVGALAVGAVLVANALAVGPALVSAAARPGRALRTE